MSVYAEIRGTTCCGLMEVYGFRTEPPYMASTPFNRQLLRGRAYMATTISSQKDAIKALKKAKFKAVGTWRNSNTGRRVTMWTRNVERSKRGKVSR